MTATASGLAFGSVYVWEVTARDNVNNATFARFTTVSARATKTYYFGTMRVAVRDANVLSYLHSDHLSSVSASTDANGKLIGVQLFAPYGEQRAEWGNVDGSWGWATHRKAESNGLTFMRARWYAAGIGRFVQPDAIVPNPADPQAFNRYAYARLSPMLRIDLDGHQDQDPNSPDLFERAKKRPPTPGDLILQQQQNRQSNILVDLLKKLLPNQSYTTPSMTKSGFINDHLGYSITVSVDSASEGMMQNITLNATIENGKLKVGEVGVNIGGVEYTFGKDSLLIEVPVPLTGEISIGGNKTSVTIGQGFDYFEPAQQVAPFRSVTQSGAIATDSTLQALSVTVEVRVYELTKPSNKKSSQDEKSKPAVPVNPRA